MKRLAKWKGMFLSVALGLVSVSVQTNASASAYFGASKVKSMGFFANNGATESTFVFVEFTGITTSATGTPILTTIPNQPTSGTSCPVTGGWSTTLVFDTNTAKGKTLLSTITAAMLAGKAVEARGSGTCRSLLVGPSLGSTAAPVAVSVEELQQFMVKS